MPFSMPIFLIKVRVIRIIHHPCPALFQHESRALENKCLPWSNTMLSADPRSGDHKEDVSPLRHAGRRMLTAAVLATRVRYLAGIQFPNVN